MKNTQNIYFLTEKSSARSSLIFKRLLRLLAAISLLTGILGGIFSLGGFPVFALPIIISALAPALILALSEMTKGKNYGALLCVIAAGVTFAFSSAGIVRSVYLWLNQIQNGLNASFGTFFEGFSADAASRRDILSFGTVLALLLAALVTSLIQRKMILIPTLLSFSLLGFNILLSSSIPVWVVILLFTGWFLVWSVRFGCLDLRVIISAVSVTAAMALFIVLLSDSTWANTGQSIRPATESLVTRIRYGEDSLPEGDLTKAHKMLLGSEPRLEIKTDRSETLYLRGYIGAKYENSSWKPLDAAAFCGDFRGMLDWLEQSGFDPGMQYSEYIAAGAQSAAAPVSVSVRNVGASRRYIYLPESAAEVEKNGNRVQDWYLRSPGVFGCTKYDFSYYPLTLAELDIPEAWVYLGKTPEQERFAHAEQVYRAFVYENYLELSDEQRSLINRAFFNGDSSEQSSQLYTTTSRIRTVLRILAKSSQAPAPIGGKDFLDSFLHGGSEGNSAYFATAAVLAYRAAGIPARYAEGYLLPADKSAANGDYVTLTDKNAHAWVEVYIDGMGWRAVEVSPGFYTESYAADVIIAVPNDALNGSNGELAGIPPSEDYELPEQYTESEPEKTIPERHIILTVLLIFLALLLLLEIQRALRRMLITLKYKRMSCRDKFFFKYREILGCMSRLVPDFNDNRPLDFAKKACSIPGFDAGLYTRTVSRLERCVYGESSPSKRELYAAEALAENLRELLYGSQPVWKRLTARYISVSSIF